ncbi:DUF6319 family protein [Amycolatopsis sp., V23-08]|jgi:hypothetical protein|uniref:DUF6319 family protein n=1 Tax=Amycolatopsis heterodermiae TaxID=3110235 RepID=A0ABU5R079_9PSEU|nr:DUF6319 family protein [Amycolatopsis sp., V23-08]MDT7801706.1 hypothetical protein [Actinomycetota bacterium]MEA5359285.1 DUF6319 family protein [Amycolatopsis sp., V23-08]
MTVDVLTHDEETASATTEAPAVATDEATTVTESASTSSEDSASAEPAAEEAPKPKRGRPKGAATASTAKKTRTVELILTVTGTADGEWQAELKNGSKWVAKGLEIPAAAVSRAAKELHSDLSGPIDEVINQAREAQAAKVAALEAELEKAKQALAELDA